MATCSQCKPNLQLPCIRALVQHYHLLHKSSVSCSYTCGEEHCHTTFKDIHSFKRHLKRVHNCPSELPINEGDVSALPAACETAGNADVSDVDFLEKSHSVPVCDNLSLEEFISNYQIQADQFIAKLYSKPNMPRNHIQTIINNTSFFLSTGYVSNLKEKVLKTLNSSSADPNEICDIQRMFEVLEAPFLEQKTEYRRFKRFIESGDFIPPQAYTMGKILKKVRRGGKIKAEYVDVDGQFVPLGLVLQKFLELPNALDDILSYINSLDPNSFSNIIQGPLWQQKIMNFKEDDIVFPLYIYFDEFEPNNPLGPHCDKLAAVYASIACLPPESRTVENIFLVLLYQSDCRVQYSNHKAFDPLIKELKSLESNGIVVNGKKIYFVTALVTGDNLGVHSITGLTESFTANFPCRFCKLHKQETETAVKEDPSKLRDRDNYNEDLSKNDSSQTGIKERCVFHQIPSFHVTTNYFVDLMHDLAEGWAHVIIVLVLKHMLDDLKCIAIESLNFRLDMFDFGPYEQNKPPLISEEYFRKNGKLKCTASEMVCLIRYFGILFGDRVPKNDPCWQLYLYLRKVTDLTHAKVLPKNAGVLFNNLVTDMHILYLSIARSKGELGKKGGKGKKDALENSKKKEIQLLTPKAHHLTHYARIFEHCGPVSHFACWRFEAKHKPMKESAAATASRVNIARTVATKAQLHLTYKFRSKKGLLCSPEVGPGDLFNISNLLEMQITLPDSLKEMDECFSPHWVVIKGTKFKSDTVLIVDIEDYGPVFGEICHILIYNNTSILFVCKGLAVLDFNEHVHAYHVVYPGTYVSVNLDDLIHPMPLYCHSMVNGELYVVLKHYI